MTPPEPPNETPEVGGRYAKYVLAVLVVVYIFNFIDRQILSILAEEIKADLGISDADIGFLYGTAFAVFYAVFGIPLGRLADVWTRKSLISIGLGFWSLMTALSGTARSFVALAGYRFGVGIGEASATPAAFSMLSDYFPPNRRATVLAIYSSGIYIGAGIGLFLGGWVVDSWKEAFPDPASAPLGLKAWQAAFLTVGLPGLAVAVWTWTLREPRRGMSEGLVTEAHPTPFREAGRSLMAVLPPFTILALAREGGARAVVVNLIALALVVLGAWAINSVTNSPTQWAALGVGVYATISWVHNLKLSDPATFGMMFRCRAFVLVTIGFPAISFVTYGLGFWSPPYMLRAHGVSLSEAGLILGLGAAVGGWLGITLGGMASDRLKARFVNARLYVGLAVTLLATPVGFAFLLAENTWVAYALSFVFSIFSPMWIGAAASTVNDLVMPRMRAVASAYYLLMNTFIGLALGPYLLGQISDLYVQSGADAGDALRVAMMWGLGMLAVAAVFLVWALRHFATDEASRLERARALGESVGERP
jgi:MFS family permease